LGKYRLRKKENGKGESQAWGGTLVSVVGGVQNPAWKDGHRKPQVRKKKTFVGGMKKATV